MGKESDVLFIVETIEINGTYYPKGTLGCNPQDIYASKVSGYNKVYYDKKLHVIDELV